MSRRPHVLFIDNFDSFSFNLVADFRARGCKVEVWRNDLAVEEAQRLALGLLPPALIVLSPGPSSPSQAGCLLDLVPRVAGKIPLFGVCLGHQAIVEALGGSVGYAGEVIHGKADWVEHDGTGVFAGIPSPFMAARYHSLAALTVPKELHVSARTGRVVMAVEHRKIPVFGVQFHPESILTPRGGELLDRVLDWAVANDTRSGPS